MTANPRRRRRRTWIGFGIAVLLVVGAVVLTAVGVSTLRHSQEGEAVGIDERPVVTLPSTPNAMLAVRDADGDLASLVVVTLLPDGRGGTVVTIPVNADANAGLAVQQVSLREEFDGVRADGVAGLDDFVTTVESMLSITIERSAVADPDQLAALIGPVTPVEVTLPMDVEGDGGVVVPAGERELSAEQAAAAIAVGGGAAGDRHAMDAAVWSALAAETPVPVSATLPTDEAGGVVPPTSVEETFGRLWEGSVQARDLAVLTEEAAPVGEEAAQEVSTDDPTTDDPTTDGSTVVEDAVGEESTDDTAPDDTVAEDGTTAEPTGAAPDDDIVVVDRRDSLFVFSQISPKLVSTPNPALSFRLEIGFTDEQLAAAPVDYGSTTEVGRLLIGQLLFLQANVVSVDATPGPEGAPEITRVEVADEQFLDDMNEFAPLMFGETEVVLADTLIAGVDVVVDVGTDFLSEDRGNTQVVVVDDEGEGADGEAGGDGSTEDSVTISTEG